MTQIRFTDQVKDGVTLAEFCGFELRGEVCLMCDALVR